MWFLVEDSLDLDLDLLLLLDQLLKRLLSVLRLPLLRSLGEALGSLAPAAQVLSSTMIALVGTDKYYQVVLRLV